MVDKGSDLKFLPVSCGLIELQEAIRAARRSSDNQPLVVALIHDYDFLDINKELVEVIEDLSADRVTRTKRINYLEKIPALSLIASRLLYQESPSLFLAILKLGAFYSIFIIIGAVLIFRTREKLSG